MSKVEDEFNNAIAEIHRQELKKFLLKNAIFLVGAVLLLLFIFA